MKTIGLIALMAAAAIAVPSNLGAALDTRAPELSTTLTIGNHTIRYGTIDPKDVMSSLKKVCATGQCETSPYELDTILATGPAKLKLTPQGIMDPKDVDLFVNAMVAAVSRGTLTEKQQHCVENYPLTSPVTCTSVEIHKQASFVGIVRRRADGSEHGNIGVAIELEIEDNKWCGLITSIGATVIGQVQSAAGGAFGVLGSLVCVGVGGKH